MQYIDVAGMEFPVIGQVERKNGDMVPLIEINMMSDERWKQLTEESAVKHFRKWYGREPESVQEAFEGQRVYLQILELEERKGMKAIELVEMVKTAASLSTPYFEKLYEGAKNLLGLEFADQLRKASDEYRARSQAHTMNIDDIKIYPCFASSTPGAKKVERKEWLYSQSGMSEFDIVLDRNNYLIDGYIGYLIAKENGLTHIPVRYGRRQIIKAVHKTGGKVYAWELPGILTNRVSVGDKVVVETSRGRRKVKVVAVEEYGQQDQKPLRMVFRVKSRAVA